MRSEAVVTGALLLGLALGWALLATLSVRFGDRPQRWAAVPAAAMALSGAGLLVLAPGAAELTALGWVWPPLLGALVVWMAVHRPPACLPGAIVGAGARVRPSGTRCPRRRLRDPAHRDRSLRPRAGERLVDVGGHRLSIRCTGSGRPAVVLEPGLGESASTLARWIAPNVARRTTVCVYDHAGHGHSDPVPARGADAARDLHVLLARAGVPGPYVLAGHSLGGMFALAYAHRYPSEVAGLALLDSMHPRQNTALAGGGPLLAVVPTLARIGLARLFFDPEDGAPAAQAAQFVRDVDAMPAELGRAAALTGLGDRPLAVLSAGTGAQPGWDADQDDLARLSSTGTHRTVAGATHASLVLDRRDAARSARTITDVVGAVRRRPR